RSCRWAVCSRICGSARRIEHADRAAIERFRRLRRGGDAYDAELAELRNRTDEVEGHSLLRHRIEVQIVLHRQIDQIGGRQTPVVRIHEIIGRVVEAKLILRRPEQAAGGVIVSVRQVLQNLEGVRRASLAQVDLYGAMAPGAALANADEVDAE